MWDFIIYFSWRFIKPNRKEQFLYLTDSVCISEWDFSFWKVILLTYCDVEILFLIFFFFGGGAGAGREEGRSGEGGPAILLASQSSPDLYFLSFFLLLYVSVYSTFYLILDLSGFKTLFQSKSNRFYIRGFQLSQNHRITEC